VHDDVAVSKSQPWAVEPSISGYLLIRTLVEMRPRSRPPRTGTRHS